MKNTKRSTRPRVLRGSIPLHQDSGEETERARGAKNLAVTNRLSPGNKPTETRKRTFFLNIGTYNARTLSMDHKIDFLIQELDKVNLDVIALTETKRMKPLNVQWKDGTQVFFGAAIKKKNATVGGVGFLIKPRFVKNIISCDIISSRLGILTLRINNDTNMKIICCYAPTSTADDSEIEEFYTSIEPLLQQRTTYTFICGDFNAKLGKGEDGEKYIGKFGLHQRNERGHKLAEFAEAEQLYVMNSFFKKRLNKRWTWEAPNGVWSLTDSFKKQHIHA